MSMIVNRRDLDFLLYEMLDVERLLSTPRYREYDRNTITAILDAAQTVAQEKYLPCAAKLDANEPTFDGERVHVIDEVKEALDAYRETGLFAAGFDAQLGGMQLPWIVNQAANGMFASANVSISDYAFLTMANANMLNHCGSEALKARFLAPLIEGRWFGTMCLSETQAGSSLSDIRTKAEPTTDGHYLISGTKMWISGGDQDISENIVHMVLAKVPGGPPGVRGISLFLVPKYRVHEDGTLGEHNHVAVAGLNHKMGHRGATNALLNFGESGECHGYLVGQEHQGLANMFHMMNEARVGVGMGAAMLGLAGYLHSLEYARNRPQGRHPQNKDPASAQVMLIEHADVKRMLMAQKAYVEGAQALIFYCALLIDEQRSELADPTHSALLLDLLTPVAKSWPSEFCLEANKLAIQVLGGYGYTREFPVERLYRDNRLNHIHEGAHAIHGIDILGRKVRMKNGAALAALMSAIAPTLEAARQDPALARYAGALQGTLDQVNTTTQAVIACDDLMLGLANATTYLDAVGHTIIAWMWLWQAVAAQKGLAAAGEVDRDFYQGKLAACRFFFTYELPKVAVQLTLVADLDDTCLTLSPEQFTGS